MRFASVVLLALLAPACNKSNANDDPDAGSMGGSDTNSGGAASGNGGESAGGGAGGANAGSGGGGEDGTGTDASAAGGAEDGADASAGDSDAGVGGAGGDGAGGSSAGGDSAGGNGSGQGIPGPGFAEISATFSDPVDGYDGSTEDYVSVTSQGTAAVDTTVADDAYGFSTSNGATSGLLRSVHVRVIGVPTTGSTFDIGTEGGDVIAGELMEYVETNLSTFSPKIFICAGTVTFDTVAGSSYLFHFTGECIPYSGGTGGVTITGTGAGTLND